MLLKATSNCYHNLTVKQSNLLSLYFVQKGTYRCMMPDVGDKGKLEDALHTEWTDQTLKISQRMSPNYRQILKNLWSREIYIVANLLDNFNLNNPPDSSPVRYPRRSDTTFA